jgi:hypothetical protein
MRRCTDITLILDKSDSMSNCHSSTIELVNSFIEERRKDPDECVMSLVQFSDASGYKDMLTRTFSGLAIKDAPRLSPNTYRLGGMTALYDAVGMTIDDVGKRLAGMPGAQRPDRVLIVVQTDGEENNSKKFPTGPTGQQMIMEKVNHQRDNYRWEFMFLGADMTSEVAEQQAQNLGIYGNNTLNYTKGSTQRAGRVMTQAVANYAGPLGEQGPQGPQGPGIYALDEETKISSELLRAEADENLGGTAKAPPKTKKRSPKK